MNTVSFQAPHPAVALNIISLSEADEETDATAFTGSAQKMLYRLYGDPRVKGWGNRWMVIWAIQRDFSWFPASKLFIHKDFKTKLSAAFRALEEKGLHREIRSFDGCYNLRYVRGSQTSLSVHSWGVAIDLNAKENPLSSEGKWSYEFLKTMLDHEIFCGQNWVGRKDPMHFALVNG
ncbi:MAG TPA: M15 family metallopeptidase [Flavipsychrobacter sp.]|nr:M15 family metallopeptidase [Flavipsychrobacter sp.]